MISSAYTLVYTMAHVNGSAVMYTVRERFINSSGESFSLLDERQRALKKGTLTSDDRALYTCYATPCHAAYAHTNLQGGPKTDTQFHFWDNFGNLAPILTILSLLQT